ncbi:Uncharacterised protein [Legionella feeleii]|uniref:Uncharacterized protein n=1 Tax=Legionella feeleii TaxID=453 RepID=A0A378IVF8_9GAMM|nr:Uncharacterised protein [Legionella feeleii]
MQVGNKLNSSSGKNFAEAIQVTLSYCLNTPLAKKRKLITDF